MLATATANASTKSSGSIGSLQPTLSMEKGGKTLQQFLVQFSDVDRVYTHAFDVFTLLSTSFIMFIRPVFPGHGR